MEPMKKFIPCPDFDLAPLKSAPRDFFSKGDPKVSGFILALASAFNDLKGYLWLVEQINKGKDPNPKVDGYNGQWSGMSLQVKRLIISLYYEVLEAIRINRALIDHPSFKAATAKLKGKQKQSWDALLAINDSRKSSSSKESRIVGLVKKIRNDISFHYYEPDNFLKGYKLWLEGKGHATERLYVSLGKNAEQTRFYFADAALEYYQSKALKDQGISEDELFNSVKSVNNAFRFILEEFLKINTTLTDEMT